ncbi:MLC2-like protein [Mya arenaria]|uniref:MLC2-like protein n=1 Tax=Mya arenaria TaxID=6604 RepID=A0ABY7E7X1_MYAAR|nr:MLC2-like protein [Mya arenaria]
MSQMSEDQMNDIMEVFNLFDNKGDGKIAASQLGDCLRSLGQNPTEQDIRKCGYVNNPEQHSAEDFTEGFKMFDKEQNGFISSAELRHILTCLGDKLTDEECDQLFQGMEDAQGNINYEDFVKNVMSG